MPTPTPQGDGSGARWKVVDGTTGETLWTIEGFYFAAALDEKRRLCQAVGGKSGWAYLISVFK